MNRQIIYQIGFYTNDGCFSVLSNKKKLHNRFHTAEMAEEKRKELQPTYKHRLEVKRM